MEEDDTHADKPADYYHTGKYCVKSHTASGDEGRLSAGVGNLNGLAVGTLEFDRLVELRARGETVVGLEKNVFLPVIRNVFQLIASIERKIRFEDFMCFFGRESRDRTADEKILGQGDLLATGGACVLDRDRKFIFGNGYVNSFSHMLPSCLNRGRSVTYL